MQFNERSLQTYDYFHSTVYYLVFRYDACDKRSSFLALWLLKSSLEVVSVLFPTLPYTEHIQTQRPHAGIMAADEDEELNRRIQNLPQVNLTCQHKY